MGKLTQIQAYADTIITASTKIDRIIVTWIDSSELRDCYIQAQKACERLIPPCVKTIERCQALLTTADLPEIILDRSLRREIVEIEDASERVAQLCETVHRCVERMSKDSNVGTREFRSRVESESQERIARPGEKMLRLARKLVEKTDQAAQLEEANREELKAIDNSDESSSSPEE